jgi:hypothetical protein
MLQVCDNEWHHYAVSVKFPEVSLYADGQLFKTEKKNPEIIDDWPLHPTKGINTTVTVGACWQGRDVRHVHLHVCTYFSIESSHFNGSTLICNCKWTFKYM